MSHPPRTCVGLQSYPNSGAMIWPIAAHWGACSIGPRPGQLSRMCIECPVAAALKIKAAQECRRLAGGSRLEMPQLDRAGTSIHYEGPGTGFPLLAIAPGGMSSEIGWGARA